MIEDEIRAILKSLLEKSKAKQIEWSSFGETPYDDDYVVSFPKSSVNVFRSHGVIGATIMNSVGTVVGSISSDENESDAEMLKELFESAREQVFRIDETLEDLKRALASKQVIARPSAAPITEDDIPF